MLYRASVTFSCFSWLFRSAICTDDSLCNRSARSQGRQSFKRRKTFVFRTFLSASPANAILSGVVFSSRVSAFLLFLLRIEIIPKQRRHCTQPVVGRRILFASNLTNHRHHHEHQPPQPPRPPEQLQEAEDGARAGCRRHSHSGGHVSFAFALALGSQKQKTFACFASEKFSHQPNKCLFSLFPPASDLDYVNLTTHADVSSRGLPCCCFLGFCVVAC